MLSSLFNKNTKKPDTPLMDKETKKLFKEGNIHYSKGELDQALEIYKKCLEQTPLIPDIHNNIGEIYLLKNDISSAIVLFNYIIKTFPDYPYGHYNMGIIYQKNGERKKALEEFKKAIKLKPAAKFYNSLSGIYCDETNLEEAIKCLNKALKLDPRYSLAHVNLSKIYLIRKQFNIAISHCERAIKISPEDPVIYNQLGRIYQTSGDYNRALEFYIKVLELSPEMVQTHYSLGNLFETKKLYSKSIYHYTIYLENSIKDLKDTPLFNELKERVEILKNIPEFYIEQGVAFYARGHISDAEDMWKKAISINPEFISANILLGGIYEEAEEWEKAEIEYRRVLDLRPDMEGIKASLEEVIKKKK
ncbi:MAG TPA: tetratricopeptide repeat protein [Candidatus Eremiobacteraeota bacterium]|nr:MAG: lipoprotein NlpI [bacterium ADurb.Bin363]HPZ07395.1 tetratricopeptide repeat protein [Candidatus Eremiobacteraeota bacterium]